MLKVDNAVIMAAGTSSRFAPLSYEMPKGLVMVKGEPLIERQIKQIQSVGIRDIYIVTGYQAEKFQYLTDKYNVKLRYNPFFIERNNNSSIRVVEDILNNTYVCSADNYFVQNPFERLVDNSYYAAVYSLGQTKEWCMKINKEGFITGVTIGGANAWYMLGHTFWSQEFSKRFIHILESEYDWPETANKLWEEIYIEHIDELHMKVRKYPANYIFEFDTLDELRQFDDSYIEDTRSSIIKTIVKKLNVSESSLTSIRCLKSEKDNTAIGFTFKIANKVYRYLYQNGLQK